MTKRISKNDLQTIGQLVQKYSPNAVAKAARALPSKPPGKPKENSGNWAVVWACIESWRARGEKGVATACRSLASDLRKHCGTGSLTFSGLRGIHREAEKRRLNDPAFAEISDRSLASIQDALSRRGAGAIAIPMPQKGSGPMLAGDVACVGILYDPVPTPSRLNG